MQALGLTVQLSFPRFVKFTTKNSKNQDAEDTQFIVRSPLSKLKLV